MFHFFLKKSNLLDKQRISSLKQHARIYKIPIKDFSLWNIALTHISFNDLASEESSYERLEFLGDSVLGLALAQILFKDYSFLSEGKMSMLKSNLANEQTLAKIGRELMLLDLVKLGKGEKLNDPRAQDKVLCDLFESTLATIFLGTNFTVSVKFVQRLFQMHIDLLLKNGLKDFKTKLQKVAIRVYKNYPSYVVVDTEGPEHGKIFSIEGTAGPFKALAKARSKKDAEQFVAELILVQMQEFVQDSEENSTLKKVLSDD